MSAEKKVWVKIDPWNKSIATTALENGADAIMVSCDEDMDKVKALGVIEVAAPKGDIVTGADVVEYEIKNQEDEKDIIKLAHSKIVIVKTSDWTIIPLENLVAQTGNLFMKARNLDEAKTFLGILEKGVDGIVIDSQDPLVVKEILKWFKSAGAKISLSKAVVKGIRPLGMGDRICVDTCTMMVEGEGMLVGNSSAALFLVHAESIENPYVEPRPFRVNAGPVHAYIRVPNDKTRYLSELKSSDEVVIVNSKGELKTSIVGRIKRESRPLLFIDAICENKHVNTIVQNAETIRLTKPDGKPISVVELKEGDEVLVALESAGRHFGHKIDESIDEI